MSGRKFCVSCRQLRDPEGFRPFTDKRGLKRGEKCAICSNARPGTQPATTQPAVRVPHEPHCPKHTLEDWE